MDQNTIHVPHGTSKATLLALNKLLQENRGDVAVTLVFDNGSSAGSRSLKLPFGINLTPALRTEIDTLLAVPNVS